MNGNQFALEYPIMEVVEKLDAGPIFCSDSIRLEEDETYGSLSNKLALLGSNKLMETISAIKKESLRPNHKMINLQHMLLRLLKKTER